MTDRTRVVIVGGGMTGLTLGYFLARAGVPHLVLEAESRPGGVVRSGIIQGHLLEWGPQRTRLTSGIRELVAELGLSDSLITAPSDLPLFVYRAGRLRRVPFSALAFLRSDLVPSRAKLRVLLEPLTRGADPEESVADYFVRKVGRDLYENLLGPLYGGLYASDPADMVVGLSLGHVLAEFGIGRSLLLPLIRRGGAVHPPPACSFRAGMETLPSALYTANLDNVWVNAPVRAMRRNDRGWALEIPDGVVEADWVVLTAPAPIAAALLVTEAPGAAESLRRLRYNPLAVVHLEAETNLRGLGYQVSFAERLATRGVTFNDSLFDRRGVYTAYLGGARAPEVVGWSDTELGAVAAREFRQATGFSARPLCVEREVMPAWDTTWSALKGMALPPGIRLAANWQSRPGLPGRVAQAKRLAGELARA